MNDCEQLKEHYEAYALGALEGEERAALDAHLERRCPVCTAELERARWLVAQLAYLAPEAEPPAALRRKVLAGAGTTKPSERRGWIPVWAWVGAAALVLFALFSIFETRRYQAELASLQDEIRAARSRTLELESERQLYQRALAIRTASGTREIDLKPSGKSALPEVHAFWHAQMGLVLTGNKIPSPAPNHTFQLWVVPKKGAPLSAGIFHPDTSGTVLLVATPSATLADAAALAVSEEPAGGLPQPTKDRILWVGPVS
jgi:anti-sigma-K factor RskA